MAKKVHDVCKCGHGGLAFPTLILIISLLWLFAEWGFISLNVPWLPLIVVFLSLKLLLHCKK